MKRKILTLTLLLGVVGAGTGAGVALANPPGDHQVCIVFSNEKNAYQNGEYVCINALSDK